MKNLLIIIAALAASNVTIAGTVEDALQQCRAEQNALRRLTCYDAIQHTTSATTATPATPAVTAKTDTNNSDSFGFEHKQTPQTEDMLNLIVSRVSYSPRKELIVEFDNGQRWRQVGSDYYSISEGERHHIKRGVLNAFFLANDNNSRTIRIRREQ